LGISVTKMIDFMKNQPKETARGIYEKALQLVKDSSKISKAPGCNKKDRIVASTKEGKFHHVTAGKKIGEYRCDRSCPHWNGIKICSHSVAVADINDELHDFLTLYSGKKVGVNLTAAVQTDMPNNAGKKGSERKRVRNTLPPVTERIPRLYGQVNINNFFVKPMNNKIKICQGCRGTMRTTNGLIPMPPNNFCIARQEKRQYKNKDGLLKTPSAFSDAHYHLNMACVTSAEPSFKIEFLVISDEVPDDIKDYILNL